MGTRDFFERVDRIGLEDCATLYRRRKAPRRILKRFKLLMVGRQSNGAPRDVKLGMTSYGFRGHVLTGSAALRRHVQDAGLTLTSTVHAASGCLASQSVTAPKGK